MGAKIVWWLLITSVQCISAARVVTEDLKIITYSRILSIICKEPKYRFPLPMDLTRCHEKNAGILQEFFNRLCKRLHVDPNALILEK